MNKSFVSLIEEAIEKFAELQRDANVEFRDVPPVLWFGDVTLPKPKILVISANPNKPDMPIGNPRIPYSETWKRGGCEPQKLAVDYNNYFRHNPATNWFGRGHQPRDIGQGRIEDFLNGLDASFYDGNYTYQAIHIDLFPFSTKEPFTEIDNQLMAVHGFPRWIDKHVKDLIDLMKPQLIIINGSSNFSCFNLCVNVGAQPYSATVFGNYTIWESNSSPKILATSINMGSYCMHNWEEVKFLGKQVRQHIKK